MEAGPCASARREGGAGAAMVTNSGTIRGTAGNGIFLRLGGTGTVTNTGSILGASAIPFGNTVVSGIRLNAGGSVGNTGTKRRFKYGPIGDTVNLASRAQGATKYLKARVLLTQSTRDRIGDLESITRGNAPLKGGTYAMAGATNV